MKKLILAAVAITALGGCVAVPVAGHGGYYGPAVPAIGVQVAPPVVFYGHSHRGHHRRHR